MLSSLPSTTEVGMSSLLPNQANKLRLSVNRGKIKVALGERDVTTREQRLDWLKTVFPTAACFNIGELAKKTPLQLHDVAENASHIFVLDHEVDKMGTFIPTEISAGAFLGLIDRIAKAVESLHQAGVHRVIIGTDHGFIVMPPELRRDAPIKDVQVDENTFGSWRFVIGKPRDDPTLISFNYEELELGSGGTARFPRSTQIFALRGTQDFFHGGISLQENCLLSITSIHEATNLERVKVRVEIPELVNPQDIAIKLKPDYRISSSPRRLVIEVRESEMLIYRTQEEEVLAEPKSVHIMLQQTPQKLQIRVYDAETYEVLFDEARKTLSRGYNDDFL